MLADLGSKVNLGTVLEPAAYYLQRPLRLLRTYNRDKMRSDLIAGITVAVIRLPLSMAFALIAELPPEMGLYTAIVGAIFGALWGSSDQIITGPTNALSLLVVGALAGILPSGTAEFAIAAGLMALMVGVFQLIMGLARLGILVNFVSHSVIVGFATGAGILIAIKQVGPLLHLSFPTDNLFQAIYGFFVNLPQTHPATAVLGLGTMLVIVILQRINPRLPGGLFSMVLASVVVYVFGLDKAGVVVIGQLPQHLPPFVHLPLLNLDLIAKLSTGALALGAIGLVQTTAISRSMAMQTGQRLDSNQEFVGQGLANIMAGLFSGYACAASFSITAVNFKAGARSPFAAVFASLFVLLAMLLLAPLAAYLPRSALAAVLILTSYGMIDRAEIGRIWRGTRGDAVIMVATLIGTLFLSIEFAVLVGILLSFALYIMRTSTPRVLAVVPDTNFKHFAHQPDRPQCPQLGVVDILGDLYFGAVNHVEEVILANLEQQPEQRFLIIRMNHVNHCDFSGIHMLEGVVRTYRDRGGDVYLVRVNPSIHALMSSTGFVSLLGADHFPNEDDIISYIFQRVLDPAICIYECPVRVFKECQNLPKRVDLTPIPHIREFSEMGIIDISPQKLWQSLHNGHDGLPPLVLDVREPREYRQGHIPEAQLVPLPKLMGADVKLPNDRQIVLVCRGGRRSRRAAQALRQIGCMNVTVLAGGMLAWEAAGLLEAIE
ncbi:MAG: sulfate permease [Ardenticatenaceae bacterium]|nr:sulfate permease [Ardenticatenaceae bacterium]